MKTFVNLWIPLVCLICTTAFAQNSTCLMPSGPMQQAGDTIPVCYNGYTVENTGTLTQCYDFLATASGMRVSIGVNVGTSIACSFPNTGVNYSNFRLYRKGDCLTIIYSSPVFPNLDSGATYTFCLDMTPVDQGCNWLASACPRILVDPNLSVDLALYSEEGEEMEEVALLWHHDFQEAQSGGTYVLEKSAEGVSSYQQVAELQAPITDTLLRIVDRPEYPGTFLYRLKYQDHNGSWSYSNEVLYESKTDFHQAVQIVPNPFHDELLLKGIEKARNYQLLILDAGGKEIFSAAGSGGELNQALDQMAPLLDPGLYFASLQGPHGRTVEKLLKTQV